MTLAHWLYLLGVLVVIATMIWRKNVVIPCILFTLFVGMAFGGNLISGVSATFNASLVAAKELFSIFLIISIMVAMLKSLTITGADRLMVVPLRKLMVNPLVSYLVIAGTTLIISLFFWPTPATPLVGALLVPVAIEAGLPPMLCAVAIAIAGQGMALAGDFVIQGAPGLTARSAGIATELVTSKGATLTIIAGVIALALAYLMSSSELKEFAAKRKSGGKAGIAQMNAEKQELKGTQYAGLLFGVLAVAMLGVIISLVLFDIKGGDASALLGGAAFLILILASMLVHGKNGLDVMADYLADGLVFAFKVMGPIIPIAGFFFLGGPEAAKAILGPEAPGYLFDIGNIVAKAIPPTGLIASFGMLILGAITGIDGSGFSGLPLVGSMAAALAKGDPNVTATLASLGQMGAIWVGGGTVIAWSSLVAVAGIVGVPVMDLVRKNFIPVVVALSSAAVIAVAFMM